MAFVSISQIAEKNRGVGAYRGGRVASNREYLVIGTGSGGKKKNGVTRKSLVVRISCALAKKARILHGDRIDMLFDPEAKVGLIKRITKGGFAASVTGKKTETIKPGEYYSITIKASHFAGMPLLNGYQECESVNVSDEGILFDLPKDVTF